MGSTKDQRGRGKGGSRKKAASGDKNARVVLAGGAVLGQTAPGGAEVAVVHRKRYDDWSLPKGKVDPGESLPVTAVREIEEETGSRCVLGRRLGTTGYPLKAGARKEVTYWAARATGGDFAPNSEVDELRWVSVADAEELVSYSLDRRILRAYSAGAEPEETGTVVLIRHARAGSRSAWSGDDDLRPLDKQGRAQAEMLAPLARAFGVQAVHSAPLVRCDQTVAPLAEQLGVDVEAEDALSDRAIRAHPRRGLRRLVEVASAAHPVAVCSQGNAIPELLRRWAQDSDLRVEDTSTRKGGCWVLRCAGEVLLSADAYPSPMPVR